VNPYAEGITGFRYQFGDHVRAFDDRRNDVDDIVVAQASQGLQAGNRCVRFADRVCSVRDPSSAELMTREGVLPFLAEGDTIPNSHPTLTHQFLGSP
jgi:hypothetical protein